MVAVSESGPIVIAPTVLWPMQTISGLAASEESIQLGFRIRCTCAHSMSPGGDESFSTPLAVLQEERHAQRFSRHL